MDVWSLLRPSEPLLTGGAHRLPRPGVRPAPANGLQVLPSSCLGTLRPAALRVHRAPLRARGAMPVSPPTSPSNP